MPTLLTDIVFPSIYRVNDREVNLPKRMAQCTPDTKAALLGLPETLLHGAGSCASAIFFGATACRCKRILITGAEKRARSARRLGATGTKRAARSTFTWVPSRSRSLIFGGSPRNGVVPIIAAPDKKLSEAWQFECRGSHQLVYVHYQGRPNTNFKAALNAILSIGRSVADMRCKDDAGRVQSSLIRLGKSIGNIDGDIGPKSRAALKAPGLETLSLAEAQEALVAKLEKAFPGEFFERTEITEALWHDATT
jgi:hypothetical protein